MNHLPEIVLDDRRFQELVSEARTRIALSCPEWTEHNVSDPGITLIELFAWMTDMLIYRLNRVPERARFLLLRRAAGSSVTFYLWSAMTHPDHSSLAAVRPTRSQSIGIWREGAGPGRRTRSSPRVAWRPTGVTGPKPDACFPST